MSDYLKIHPQPCQCPFCECERRYIKAQSELASARLLADCQELLKYKARMEWLHDCSSGMTDPDGCEWGIYRVKWKDGKAIEVWQTNSDFSDLDAEMAREKSANAPDERRPEQP